MTFIAAGLIGGGALVSGLASYFGGREQANAATQAANTESQASQTASAAQAQAARDSANTIAQAQRDAANTEAASIQKGIDFGQDIYNTNKANSQGYIDAGQTAMNGILGMNDPNNPANAFNFSQQTDPSYQWRLDQGMKALQASAAARGGLLSGNTLTGITDYAQGAASQEYQNAFNRYMDQRQQRLNSYGQVAGVGSSALNSLNFSGGMMANTVGNLYSQQGAAQGAGIANAGSALAAGTTSAANANAAGTMGSANALASGDIASAGADAAGYMGAANAVNSAASAYGNYASSNALLAALRGKQGGTEPDASVAAPVYGYGTGYTDAMGHYVAPQTPGLPVWGQM